ncbi:hypothetical protein SAMN05216420_101196 [Nitrosospira sp. Nl5]|nr:hypothetical protein SAMN05216420_101196 [Nitrosospira sp. Nl5]
MAGNCLVLDSRVRGNDRKRRCCDGDWILAFAGMTERAGAMAVDSPFSRE